MCPFYCCNSIVMIWDLNYNNTPRKPYCEPLVTLWIETKTLEIWMIIAKKYRRSLRKKRGGKVSGMEVEVTSPQKAGAFKSREFGDELLILKGRKPMKKSKFTETQIAFAIKQSETGTRMEEVCRKMGISEATFYNWKKRMRS